MAAKGWTGQVAAAAGAAAGTGAAQLGMGYGLGVVVWPSAGTADDSVWLGSLGWATWIAASATVFGAVIGGRFGRAHGGPWRFALAVSAAVGALLTVLLVALPARAAVRADTFSPQSIAAGYAAVGVVLGLFIAYWAVVSRSVATNLVVTAGWLWALAVAAVAADVFWHRPSAAYPSSWQFAAGDGGTYGTIYWPSALLTLLAAFVIGVLGAWSSARRGNLGVGTASSGAVGPLLVAAAFLVLAPQLTRSLGPLESAYLIAPYAVLAGLAGSAATVALGQRTAARRTADGSDSTGPSEPAGVVAVPAQRPASAKPAPASAKSASASATPDPAPATPGSPSATPGSTSATPASASATSTKPRNGNQTESPNPGTTERRGGSADAASEPAAVEPQGFATGRAKARPPAARPGRPGPAKAAVPMNSARPAASGSARTGEPAASAGPATTPQSAKTNEPAEAAEPRSTVARPPAAPTVAQINPGRTGSASAAAKKADPARSATPAKRTGAAKKAAPRHDGAPRQDG
ncbi:Hansenula MRAKII killer toxin-resistant protein 1 [Actinoplanes sp. NPDC049316]|uniref:Hansenula MRAKII killer toxin-resistant protein 1 n=1 Tax=Actinoplanes sp. NPDC049316 TaxID=3154727 RepID=UPI0034368662